MDREFHRRLAGLTLFALVCGWTVLSGAQDDADAPRAPASAQGGGAAEKLPPEASPLVGTPKTPEELFEAAILMSDIARFDLARSYLDKLEASDLDDEALAALRDKFGAAPFVRLARIKELNPTAEKLLDRSNAAMTRRARDPERIAALVKQLDGDPEQAIVARFELKSAGTVAVPALLNLMIDPAYAGLTDHITEVLVSIGEDVIPQVEGALEAPDVELQAAAATVLGQLRSSSAEMSLWRMAFARDESAAARTAAREALARILNVPEPEVERLASAGLVKRLVKAAELHYRGAYPWKADDAGSVTLWNWNARQNTIVPTVLSPEAASDVMGLRLAKDALALAPEQRAVQVLYLSLALAADIRRAGFDKPLPIGPGSAHDVALTVGSEVVADVLGQALAASRPATAVAALHVLAQVGTLPQLGAGGTRKSPILAALDYPDPRVQFAAAVTILQLDPPNSFRGGTRVVEVLKRAAGSGGKPVAVVGEVSPERAGSVGGFVAQMGYEPLVFTSGRDAFSAAASRSDVELIVLHPNIIRWALSETLTNLRADARTASIPVVIHGPAELETRMQSHVRNFRLVSFALMATQPNDFRSQVDPVLEQIKTPAMTPEQRAQQRVEAVAWLAHIALGRRTKAFDISSAEETLSEALADPKLAGSALDAVAEIPSRDAQRRIAGLALAEDAPVSLRESAAMKLAFHIQRFGLLLTRDIIGQLHQVWSDETQPPEVRTALGGVVGSLKPDAAMVGKRLQRFAGSAK